MNSLPEAQLQALRTNAQVELARRGAAVGRGLLEFVYLTHTREPYQAGWVHADLCRRLENFSRAVAEGRSPRLIITMPPRHGKTAIVSQRFPVWHLGQHPHHDVVCASYGQSLADESSLLARSIAQSDEARAVFPDLGRPITTAKSRAHPAGAEVTRIDRWTLPAGGGYRSTGVGGGLTGHGANILIIDDPIKNREEAESRANREAVFSWYRSTAYTRLAPGAGIIVMMTRWHEADLAGCLLDHARQGTGDQWELVSYEAIASRDEPYRKAGEALHPERYPVAVLEATKRVLGTYDWSALYLQQPRPSGGAIFQASWFRQHVPGRPQNVPIDYTALSVDCSFKGSKDSDFVSIQLWGKKGLKSIPLDHFHGRMDYVTFRRKLIEMLRRWPFSRYALIEATANGPAIMSDLGEILQGRSPDPQFQNIPRIPLVPFNPGKHGDKVARARAVTPQFESGLVEMPDPQFAPWLAAYESEMCAFPSAAHDDQVDATTQFLIHSRDESLDPRTALDAMTRALHGR